MRSTAYVRRDTALAHQVLNEDDQLDALKTQVFRELLTYMLQDPATVEPALDLILISRHLERIGDHATNIAEDVDLHGVGPGRPPSSAHAGRRLARRRLRATSSASRGSPDPTAPVHARNRRVSGPPTKTCSTPPRIGTTRLSLPVAIVGRD